VPTAKKLHTKQRTPACVATCVAAQAGVFCVRFAWKNKKMQCIQRKNKNERKNLYKMLHLEDVGKNCGGRGQKSRRENETARKNYLKRRTKVSESYCNQVGLLLQ
jgi:hypothetical protein